MNQVVYGLHTGQAKKQISYREAKAIEMIFQKAFPDEAHSCSQFFHKGISKFWIEEVTNKAGKRYWMHLKVNMARAIAVSEYGLMPYTVSNVKKLIRETSKLLKKLKLDDRNADFSIWRWERFDCGFDVSVEHPEIFMSLLDKSIYVNAAKKRCRRIAFTPANSNACESIRFGNDSYTYNVYIKLAGLINKEIAITPDIHREVDNIVRVERQNHLSVIKQIVPKCEVGGLASNKTMNLILKTLTDDIEAFWGKGDYYSSNAIRSKYRSIPDVARLIPAMVEFTANSLDDRQHLYTADIKESFQEYGIMPVGICKDDAHKYQIQEIKGLYNMVTDCYAVPDKRAYHEFPVPHQCSDGRYKAGITFHMVNDTRKQPVSIAKGTIEEYEKAVFIGLKKAYATNVKYHCMVKAIPDILEKSKKDILRFYKVVESKTVKDMTREFIKLANLKE